MSTSRSPRKDVERVLDLVDVDELRELVVALTSIPSPTGEERHAAEALASWARGAGAEAGVQELDEAQASAWARLPGSGSGPTLVLYAPIDTLTVGTEDEDVPWIGPELRPDERPRAVVDGRLVRGLGASNPKAHAVAALGALLAVRRSGCPLSGDLLAGFGAGGMPTEARPGRRPGSGHGVGCAALIDLLRPDLAVIAKPGWTVSWEEVGLAWVRVTVHGTHTYVGSRHRLPFTDAIAGAAAVIGDLVRWFAEYTALHTHGTVAPQAVVGSIEGGWPRMAAVTPAVCRFTVDLRLDPDTSPSAAHGELSAALASSAAAHGVELDHELVVGIPGTRTDVDHPLVASAIGAWEAEAGRPHEVITGNSGSTDANILRAAGVPTVRVGMPKVPGITDFQLGMNTVDVDELARLTRLLVRVAIDVVSAPR